MQDKIIRELIKSIDIEVEPKTEVKDRILSNIISNRDVSEDCMLTSLQKIFFLRPLRTASCLATIVSAILWVIFGNGYINILASII